jgi:hypothetical protein
MPGVREQFDRAGYVVLRGLLAPDEVETIRILHGSGGKAARSPDYPKRSRVSPRRSRSPVPRMTHPHRIPEKPVGPVSLRYLLDERVRATLTVPVRRGTAGGAIHVLLQARGRARAGAPSGQLLPPRRADTCIAAWFAIDDADEENGGLMVVPQTNDMDIVCPEAADSSRFFTKELCPVPPGKAGGADTSQSRRRTLLQRQSDPRFVPEHEPRPVPALLHLSLSAR